MRILIVGASGTIGREVVNALAPGNEIVAVGHRQGSLTVDISDSASLRRLYQQVGRVDAVVSAAGSASFRPLHLLTDDDFAFSLANKLMGQVNPWCDWVSSA